MAGVYTPPKLRGNPAPEPTTPFQRCLAALWGLLEIKLSLMAQAVAHSQSSDLETAAFGRRVLAERRAALAYRDLKEQLAKMETLVRTESDRADLASVRADVEDVIAAIVGDG